MGICKISIEMVENFDRSYSRDRSKSRDRSLSPRRHDNNNRQNGKSRFRSRSRSRSNSRITTNMDRIRCYRCREYDHFANECPNTIAHESDCLESDNAALQVMATDIGPDDMQDIDRYMEDTEYLNL